jgi:DNA-binding XRE family transcriptional regulator
VTDLLTTITEAREQALAYAHDLDSGGNNPLRAHLRSVVIDVARELAYCADRLRVAGCRSLRDMRDIRIAAGVTQHELAERAGLSLRTITRVEERGGWPLRSYQRKAVCEVLGVEWDAVEDIVREGQG